MVSVWRAAVGLSCFLVAVAESGESIEKPSEAAGRWPRFHYHCTPNGRPAGTGQNRGAKSQTQNASGGGTVKFADEIGEGFGGGGLDGVVKGNAHAADGAVAGGANEASRGGFDGEFLFYCFHVAGGFHVLGGR